MTALKPYPEYKDSGVEWLGRIPATWGARALRYIATVETGSKDTVDADPDGSYPFIVRSATALRIASYSYDTEAILTAGDGDVGEIFHHLVGKFDVHQRVYVLHNFRGVVPRFLYYYFSSEFGNVVAYGGIQTTVSSLRRPMFTSFPVLVPSLDDQQAIARFLDRETAEIDAFIGDQEDLIGLLTERRAATITHAVSKGLDPSVPMKHSGVEWLGEIPESWETQKLGWLARIGNGSTPSRENPQFWIEGTIPWLSSSVVNKERVKAAAEFVTADARRLCHLPMVRAGSLLVGLTGQGRTRGMAARLAIDSTISQHLAFVEPRAALCNDYTFWVLTSAYAHLRFQSDGNGGTKGGLTCEELARLRIPVPPSLDIQRTIAEYLDREAAELDAAIADAREAIALSRERRAALISAAVTGKIDVRGAA